MRFFIFSLLLPLVAIGSSFASASDGDRWIVVPASQNAVKNQGSPFFFAWRLDTKTGALEMCTYDPGGWMMATKLPAPESLNCSPANVPNVPY